MKYIDAERLKAEIKLIQQSLGNRDVRSNQVKKIRTECLIEFCKCIIDVIDSLQKEQPFPRWIHANYSDKPEIRYTPSGTPYLQNGFHMIWLSDLETLPKDGTDLTNPGQEHPIVDLEEYLSAKLFFLGADLIRHKPYSFNRGLNVGMTKAYGDILKKLNARKK